MKRQFIKASAFIVWWCILLHLHRFEVQVSYHYTNVITPKLQVWKVSYLWCIFLVTVVLLPAGFTLIYQSTCSCLSILMLVNEATHFRWRHHIPATIWPNHNEPVCIFKFEVLDLWLRYQANSLGFKISKRPSYGNSWPFFISPDSRRSNLLTLMSQTIYFPSLPFNSFSLVRSYWLMIIWKFDSQLFLVSNSIEDSSWVSKVGYKSLITLKKHRNGTCAWTGVIDTTRFQLFLSIFEYFGEIVLDISLWLQPRKLPLMGIFL